MAGPQSHRMANDPRFQRHDHRLILESHLHGNQQDELISKSCVWGLRPAEPSFESVALSGLWTIALSVSAGNSQSWEAIFGNSFCVSWKCQANLLHNNHGGLLPFLLLKSLFGLLKQNKTPQISKFRAI